MRILVTGGAGFFGSSVVKKLSKLQNDVIVLDDLSTGSLSNLNGFEGKFILGSILDDDTLKQSLIGVEAVIHMAVRNVRESLTKPLINFESNAVGTLKLLEKCRDFSVKKFIYCSSSEVYGNSGVDLLDADETLCRPSTVYGAGKLAGELLTKAYGETHALSYVIVRPFNVYGPNASKVNTGSELVTRFVHQRLSNEPFTIYGEGSQIRDLTYVEDSAGWIVEVLDKYESVKYKTLNLGSNFAPSVLEVANFVAAVLHPEKPLKFNFIDERPGDISCLRPNLEKTKLFLDLKSETSFETGLEIVAKSILNMPKFELEEKNW